MSIANEKIKMDISPAEFEVGKRIASGLEPKEIARVLHKSYHTVACHVRHIREKNNFNNVAEFTMNFVLEYGDPRLLTVAVLIILNIGVLPNYALTPVKRVRNRTRNRTSKRTSTVSSKLSRGKEYYL